MSRSNPTTMPVSDAPGPQIQAGHVVYQLFIGEITREEAEGQLLALGYQFCGICFAHMPVAHEAHWPTFTRMEDLPVFGIDDPEAYRALLPKKLGGQNTKLAAQPQ